jgi:hypothetical protein
MDTDKMTTEEIAPVNECKPDIIPLSDVEMLREFWDVFTTCDFAGETDNFVERMEAAGFIELVPVTRKILAEEDHAADRGIELGGNCWQLTTRGREVLDGYDYYDGKQLTAAERETLKKRGQPEVIINRKT